MRKRSKKKGPTLHDSKKEWWQGKGRQGTICGAGSRTGDWDGRGDRTDEGRCRERQAAMKKRCVLTVEAYGAEWKGQV